MIIIDTSVWIPLLNGINHPKANRARAVIEGPEDIGVPGIILEEILRTLRNKGKTIRSPADCLIAACPIEETALLLEADADFHTIAEVAPLKLLEG